MPPNLSRSDELLTVLCKALGINLETVQRIVIDVDCRGGVPKVYVQQVAGRQIIDIDWPTMLSNPQIKFTDRRVDDE